MFNPNNQNFTHMYLFIFLECLQLHSQTSPLQHLNDRQPNNYITTSENNFVKKKHFIHRNYSCIALECLLPGSRPPRRLVNYDTLLPVIKPDIFHSHEIFDRVVMIYTALPVSLYQFVLLADMNILDKHESILHECSCFIEFIKQVGKRDTVKWEACRAFYLFFATSSILATGLIQ